MKDWLIDDDRLDIPRKSVLPGEGFFIPDSIEDAKEEQEAREALTGAGTVVVADPDADGLGCVALVRETFGEGALVPAGPHEISEALDYLEEYADPGARVFICDLCPDDASDIEGLDAVTDAHEVRWFDHHQWDEDLAEAVRAAGAELVVGPSEEVCTTDVALRELGVDADEEFDPKHVELAAVTRDHDLWLREDERSDDLADYAYWADPEEYIETVQAHGPDLPADVTAMLAERRVEKEALVEAAVDRGSIREVNGWTVGVTYGRCSQNEVAEAFREQGADASVVVKPSGAASIRGTDAFERCHEVAGQVNGGGHPKAAGCKPDIYDDMLDYAHHWSTRGAVAKQVILQAFRALERDGEDGEEAA